MTIHYIFFKGNFINTYSPCRTSRTADNSVNTLLPATRVLLLTLSRLHRRLGRRHDRVSLSQLRLPLRSSLQSPKFCLLVIACRFSVQLRSQEALPLAQRLDTGLIGSTFFHRLSNAQRVLARPVSFVNRHPRRSKLRGLRLRVRRSAIFMTITASAIVFHTFTVYGGDRLVDARSCRHQLLIRRRQFRVSSLDKF